MSKLKRRVQVEIDMKALVRNYRKIAAHVRPMKVLCVLKANAYGLGVGAYAKALASAGCTMFGVAEPFEALELIESLKTTNHQAPTTKHPPPSTSRFSPRFSRTRFPRW